MSRSSFKTREGATIIPNFSVFPNVSTLSTDDYPILQRMESCYTESITMNQAFWGEADTDTRWEAGDQSLWDSIYGNLPATRRRVLAFNRIRRVKNMIGGHQRRNRKSTIAVPVENADSETADQLTKILMWVHSQEGVLETISDAFDGALVTGMNLLEVWLDFRGDPISGNIKVDNTSYNGFLIDPYFRKADLSDCNFIWKRSFITKREVMSLLPDREEEIISLNGNAYGNARDAKFQFLPESYNYATSNLLSYDQFYYRDFRTQRLVVDTKTGEAQEWKGKDDDKLKDFLNEFPELKLIEQEIPTVALAIVVQGRVMYHGPNPLGIDKYPFVPVFAYYVPQMPYFPYRIQGVVRGLRDAQFLYNHRRVIELDILESQVNSGWIFKEDALVNPEDVYMSGQGRGLALKKGASMADVQQIPAPQVPPSMIQLSELLAREVMEISGVNEELLGSASDDKAGILSMLRQGAGLTTLQILFDNLDRAQKLLGQLTIDIIQTNFTPGKVKKILEGKEPSPQFYSKAFGKYGIVVEDGINTSTQRQMQFAQLIQLREIGVPIPDEQLIEACTLQNKKDLIDSLKNNREQQMQLQQTQAQMQMAEIQARINSLNAQARANEGLGNERDSRVAENHALAYERRAKAINEEEHALLEKVRLLKELDGIDIDHLHKLMKAANEIKQDTEYPIRNGSEVGNLEAL